MSLLNKYLPDRQFAERHSIKVGGNLETVLEAACRFQPTDDPLIGRMIQLRELPNKLLGKPSDAKAFGIDTFTLLERSNAEVAFGLVGRFWRLDFGLEEIPDAVAFTEFARQGVAKLVMTYEVSALSEDQTYLTTQTCIFCPDRASRRKIRLYWFAIRAVSGLIRRRTLRLIKVQVENVH